MVIDAPFNVPVPVTENSIEEDPVGAVQPDHNPVKQYQIIDSGTSKGKPKLLDLDGFSYTVRVRNVFYVENLY